MSETALALVSVVRSRRHRGVEDNRVQNALGHLECGRFEFGRGLRALEARLDAAVELLLLPLDRFVNSSLVLIEEVALFVVEFVDRVVALEREGA